MADNAHGFNVKDTFRAVGTGREDRVSPKKINGSDVELAQISKYYLKLKRTLIYDSTYPVVHRVIQNPNIVMLF